MDDQWRTETEIVRSCRSVAESVKRRWCTTAPNPEQETEKRRTIEVRTTGLELISRRITTWHQLGCDFPSTFFPFFPLFLAFPCHRCVPTMSAAYPNSKNDFPLLNTYLTRLCSCKKHIQHRYVCVHVRNVSDTVKLAISPFLCFPGINMPLIQPFPTREDLYNQFTMYSITHCTPKAKKTNAHKSCAIWYWSKRQKKSLYMQHQYTNTIFLLLWLSMVKILSNPTIQTKKAPFLGTLPLQTHFHRKF